MKPQYEVADIFRRYGAKYKKTHAMNVEQRKVMAAIMACRTARLGGHSEVCDYCGTVNNSYNSCRNRHCPKCQTMTKEQWLDNRRNELLPCGYFHIVFTLPHCLNPLILANRRELLTCLFAAVKQTLFAFAADPQWKLEGKPGILTILHTWSQVLIDHFHLHCLVPAGVLSFDNRRWIKSNDKFLFQVESLAKEFKKQYLSMVESRLKELVLPEKTKEMTEQAWEKSWITYAKKPFAGPEQVLEYLGRYTHRIAISNHRIKSIDDGQVVFTYKDRSNNNETKRMTLEAGEFIRRFLLHVLPSRFMKIRYYGFLANIHKKKAVLLIHRLIGKYMEHKIFIKETLQEKVLRLTGKDIFLCPHCQKGQMIYRGNLPALNTG
jgi:Putative transposase/Transposase zinc-binding domain